jgi:hypothetical protein
MSENAQEGPSVEEGAEIVPEIPTPEPGVPVAPRMAPRITQLYGEPVYRADAPWRLDAGQATLPFLFIVRDANIEGIRVQRIEIACWKGGKRIPVGAYQAPFAGQGSQVMQVFEPEPIPVARFGQPEPGDRIRIQTLFYPEHPEKTLRPVERWLKVYLAKTRWPLADDPAWVYGDLHYHSSYTNDVKEFGNPIGATRKAARAIGLDFIAVTDHSVDLAAPPTRYPRLDAGRWAQLGQDVVRFSDGAFRFLRGEEVSLIGSPPTWYKRPLDWSDTLHLLVYGHDLDEMIPGAFAQSGSLTRLFFRLKGFPRQATEHLFGKLYSLPAALAGREIKDGQPHLVPGLVDCHVSAQNALAFAAHPYGWAQGVGGTWLPDDVRQPGVRGLQLWNTRRRHRSTAVENPFEDFHHPRQRNLKDSHPCVEKGLAHWEGFLRQDVDAWAAALRRDPAQEPGKLFILGGSDAHGMFNYDVAWGIEVLADLVANDNALGKVRTCFYFPDHEGPELPVEGDLLDAIGAGRCLITDGPLAPIWLRSGQQKATMGETLVVSKGAPLQLRVMPRSTAEFGEAFEATLHIFQAGERGFARQPLAFASGEEYRLELALSARPGALWLAAETCVRDGETYHCYTNPIWFRPAAPG